MIKEIYGDIFKQIEFGIFDVIAHGCNCFCIQEQGLWNKN